MPARYKRSGLPRLSVAVGRGRNIKEVPGRYICQKCPVVQVSARSLDVLAESRLVIAKRGRGSAVLLLEILDSLLDPALEAMGCDPAAQTGAVGAGLTGAKTPGCPVAGQRASEVGVVLQILTELDSLGSIGGDFQCHFASTLSCPGKVLLRPARAWFPDVSGY